jgi:hypothetical protein
MAIAKQKAKATQQPPKGMTLIAGGYANSWDVEVMPILEGHVESPPKVVTLTQGGKKTDRKCVEVKTEDGARYTLWESAALVNFFEVLAEKAPCNVWVAFQGYGKAKKGQNAPKLFEAAIGE